MEMDPSIRKTGKLNKGKVCGCNKEKYEEEKRT